MSSNDDDRDADAREEYERFLEKGRAEARRLHNMISEAKTNIDTAMESGFWSWTREYSLGMLKIASLTLDQVLKKGFSTFDIDDAPNKTNNNKTTTKIKTKKSTNKKKKRKSK